MKKILSVIGLTSLILCACASSEASGKSESNFILISDEAIGKKDVSIIKHKDTGCHYMIARGGYGTTAITQMDDKDDKPYCE